jgi:hypothetical protein
LRHRRSKRKSCFGDGRKRFVEVAHRRALVGALVKALDELLRKADSGEPSSMVIWLQRASTSSR